MKLSLSWVLVAAWLGRATPVLKEKLLQEPWNALEAFPGFDYDLSERRLIQFDLTAEPVWITEFEKIQAKAEGRNFMDMYESHSIVAVLCYLTLCIARTLRI
jgi:hypothetical protein